jgi:hypothetical protein
LAWLAHRTQKRLFPYHLGEYVCRVLRVSPFAFYRDILADNMKTDAPYDAIPNFTAADIASVVGVGRNQYIAIMQQAKSKMLWRVNKGLVRDLLPELPQNTRLRHPWWRVCVVNLGEVEYRTMSRAEAEVCRMAANHADGVQYSAVDASAVASLYARGLVWFNIRIDAADHVSIPPLEGFVSNKTASISIDPLETLLYQIFVAASESVTVSELADILDTSVDTVKIGVSMACRLGFCNKLDRAASGQEEGLRSPVARDRKSIALVVDSAVTGFLMMGALTPEVKKHSVTLFEGGRVYGAGVIDELVRGLEASIEMSRDFEGEMLELGRTSRSMAAVLRSLQAMASAPAARAGGPPKSVELLRKESIEQLADKDQAERILVRSHDVLICAAGLQGPALPIDCVQAGGPTLFGPSAMCLTPWVNVALYKHCGDGPQSCVIPAGRTLESDDLLGGANTIVLWRWDGVHAPQTLSPTSAVFDINTVLQTTAVMVQPLRCRSRHGQSGDIGEELVYAPLPFRRNLDGTVDAFTSLDGDPIAIEVGAAVETALETMGLMNNVGYISFLDPHYSSGPSFTRDGEAWLPLGVALGIPLYPVGLCEAMCARLAAPDTDMFSSEACARQKARQVQLDACVEEVCVELGGGSRLGACPWPEVPFVVPSMKNCFDKKTVTNE